MYQLSLFTPEITQDYPVTELEKQCQCGSQQAYIIETPQLIHKGKLQCVNCGKFQKWLPKNKLMDIAQKLAKAFDGTVIDCEVK